MKLQLQFYNLDHVTVADGQLSIQILYRGKSIKITLLNCFCSTNSPNLFYKTH